MSDTETVPEPEPEPEPPNVDELVAARDRAREDGDKALAREIDQHLLLAGYVAPAPEPQPDNADELAERAADHEGVETADAPAPKKRASAKDA